MDRKEFLVQCLICKKHQDWNGSKGCIIHSDDFTTLSHFPIFEGESVLKGYLVLEPNRHLQRISSFNENELHSLGKYLAKAEALLMDHLQAEQVYVFKIGDIVSHIHFHIIPRYAGTPREFWGTDIRKWNQGPKVNFMEMKTLCQNLRTHL